MNFCEKFFENPMLQARLNACPAVRDNESAVLIRVRDDVDRVVLSLRAERLCAIPDHFGGVNLTRSKGVRIDESYIDHHEVPA